MHRVKDWAVKLLCGICLLLLAGCGSSSSDRANAPAHADPSTSTYKPTPMHPQEVGERLVGPSVCTIDARSNDVWIYFDFSRDSVVAVQNPKTDAWDLAFRRHTIRTNGGDTNPAGRAAVADLGKRDFATVMHVPADATFLSDVRSQKRLFSHNPAVEKWYIYSYLSNVLVPKPVVYIVRTQDGKYAKLRLLSYYCEGGVSGCMTFEYVYQGDGSTHLASSSARLSP